MLLDGYGQPWIKLYRGITESCTWIVPCKLEGKLQVIGMCPSCLLWHMIEVWSILSVFLLLRWCSGIEVRVASLLHGMSLSLVEDACRALYEFLQENFTKVYECISDKRYNGVFILASEYSTGFQTPRLNSPMIEDAILVKLFFLQYMQRPAPSDTFFRDVKEKSNTVPAIEKVHWNASFTFEKVCSCLFSKTLHFISVTTPAKESSCFRDRKK